MKRIALAVFLISSSIFAETSFNTVKVSDGKTAYCKSKYDIYRSRTGVYTGKAVSAEVSEDKIKFEIELKFLTCQESAGEFSFVFKSPYATFEYLTVPSKDVVKAKAIRVDLKAYKDGVYKILTNQELPDEANQTRTIEVSLEDVLNAEENEKVLKGEKVTGNFDFWISKKMNYSIESREINFSDLVNFGSFRVNFELNQSDEGLKVILK